MNKREKKNWKNITTRITLSVISTFWNIQAMLMFDLFVSTKLIFPNLSKPEQVILAILTAGIFLFVIINLNSKDDILSFNGSFSPGWLNINVSHTLGVIKTAFYQRWYSGEYFSWKRLLFSALSLARNYSRGVGGEWGCRRYHFKTRGQYIPIMRASKYIEINTEV